MCAFGYCRPLCAKSGRLRYNLSQKIYARVFYQPFKRFSTIKSMNARTLVGILIRDDTSR